MLLTYLKYMIFVIIFLPIFFIFYPYGAHVDGDTGYYFSMVAQLASNGPFKINETFAPVGYPVFLYLIKFFFNNDLLKSALFINAISFLITFILLFKVLQKSVFYSLSNFENIIFPFLIFLLLFLQQFNSRIIFSAWPEGLFIAFNSLGFYFLGKTKDAKNLFKPINTNELLSLFFLIIAWSLKFVGIISIFTFFLFVILNYLNNKLLVSTIIKKTIILLFASVLFFTPIGAIYIAQTGSIFGEMSNPKIPQYLFINYTVKENFSDRFLAFFNNIFSNIFSPIYLYKIKTVLIVSFVSISFLIVIQKFALKLKYFLKFKVLLSKIMELCNIEWFFWSFAYIISINLKLLEHNFSVQALNRYSTLLIPFVCIFLSEFMAKFNKLIRLVTFFVLFITFSIILYFSIRINYPNYSEDLKIAYINNSINLRGFADFQKIEQALDNIQSIYFLPDHNNKWAVADKFYAYFPCKEFYVGRDWRFGGYDERIYDIPNFTSTYSIVSDSHFNIIQELILGKGLILKSFTALGFNIFLIKPYYSNSILSNYKVYYRNKYLGHGFISHGCQ